MARIGLGVFWNRGDSHIWLWAPARVAVALGVQRERAVTWIPASYFVGPLRLARARLAATAVSAIRCGRPTSTAAIGAMVARSRRTVRRYITGAGATRTENVEPVMALKTRADLRLALSVTGPTLRIRRFHGTPRLCKLLPNTITTLHVSGPSLRSRQRRLNRRLSSVLRALPVLAGRNPARDREQFVGTCGRRRRYEELGTAVRYAGPRVSYSGVWKVHQFCPPLFAGREDRAVVA